MIFRNLQTHCFQATTEYLDDSLIDAHVVSVGGILVRKIPIDLLRTGWCRDIGILLPNNQRQHRTLHIQEDVLPYALY